MNELENVNETRNYIWKYKTYWWIWKWMLVWKRIMNILTHKDWRYFDIVIQKAMISCKNSLINEYDHFVVNDKMVKIGSCAKKKS